MKIAVKIFAVALVLMIAITGAEATDYADLVERVMPSMVMIHTNMGTGSGFFTSPEGDLLTNYHVVKGAENIIITMNDGRKINAVLKDLTRTRI